MRGRDGPINNRLFVAGLDIHTHTHVGNPWALVNEQQLLCFETSASLDLDKGLRSRREGDGSVGRPMDKSGFKDPWPEITPDLLS